jgi:hypothetical protein
MIEPIEPDADLDDLRRDELGELDPMYAALADVLDHWLFQARGREPERHDVGTFLALLDEAGYDVTAQPPTPSLDSLIPEPED